MPTETRTDDRGEGGGALPARLRGLLADLPVVTLGCVAIVLGLRAFWFDAPLGNDEGGLAYVAQSWSSGHFAYGDLFIDRPPLLIAVFRLATLVGGTEAIRILGLLAAVAICAASSLLARRLGGPRAGRWAAVIAAILGSSIALGSVFTPAELLAAVPSAFSVALLVSGLTSTDGRRRRLAGAGALAVVALLVKQSFGDAVLAGVAGLAAAAFFDRDRRARLRDAGAWFAGAGGVLAALAIFYALSDASTASVIYSLLGFRVDVNASWTGTAPELLQLFAGRAGIALVASGLIVVVAWSLRGWIGLRRRPVLFIVFAAWGLGGAAGILAGNSYWNHYLIQLIPFASVAAALALAQTRRVLAILTAATLALATLGGVAVAERSGSYAKETRVAASIGRALESAAGQTDTAYVLYSQANVLYYSGLDTPYPYNWSLMIRSIPGAVERLRGLLDSPRRPDWIVLWELPDSYGLDRSGRTEELLRAHYRESGHVCGKLVLVRKALDRPSIERDAACPALER